MSLLISGLVECAQMLIDNFPTDVINLDLILPGFLCLLDSKSAAFMSYFLWISCSLIWCPLPSFLLDRRTATRDLESTGSLFQRFASFASPFLNAWPLGSWTLYRILVFVIIAILWVLLMLLDGISRFDLHISFFLLFFHVGSSGALGRVMPIMS